MKKLLAVLCFVPVVFCLYVIIHASIIDPKGSLIMLGDGSFDDSSLGVIVVGVIVYEASKLIGNKLIALGARLWRGK